VEGDGCNVPPSPASRFLTGRLAIAGLGALLVATTTFATERSVPQRWSHRTWKMNDLFAGDGADGSVRDLWVAPDASLVIATTDGLLRFDGETFSALPLDTPSDESPLVGRLSPGRHREVLVALGSGRVLSIMGGVQSSLATSDYACRENLATSVKRAGDGSVWVLYASAPHASLLRRIAGGRAEWLGESHGISSEEWATSLAVDDAGQVWIACSGSLRVFRGGRFETVAPLPGNAATIAAATSGGLWIASSGRILRLDGQGTLETVPIREPRAAPAGAGNAIATCRALSEDSAGRVWISSSRYGLFVLEDGVVQRVPIGETWTTAAIDDTDGNVWVGTRLAIHRIQPSVAWPSDSPTMKPLESMAADGSGATWFVTVDGDLHRQPAGSDDLADAVSFREAFDPGDAAVCVASAGDGTAWVGLSTGAVLHHADGRFSRVRALPAWEGHPIASIAVTSAGDVWATSNGHLLRLHDRTWTVVTKPDTPGGSTKDERDVLAEDAAGHIWAVCGRRLLRAAPDGSRVEVLRASDTVEGPVRGIVARSSGDVWIAVGKHGLMRWRDGAWATVDHARGLPTSALGGMTADRSGRLWCAAARLVFAVQFAELDRVADGTASLCHCWTLPPAEETDFLESVASPRCPMICDDLGRIIVSRQSGYAVCDPAQLRSALPVPVSVERVQSDHAIRWVRPWFQTVSGTVPVVTLPAGSRSVEVFLRTATLATNANVRVACRLDGIDDAWQEVGDRVSVAYTSVPAGTHQFHVRSSTDVGRWQEPEPALVLVVEPPFHDTWLFRVGVLGTVAAATATVVALVLRQRAQRRLAIVRQETAVERERMRLARDMHDAVGTNLTQIALLAEVAKGNDGPDQAEQLDVVARISRDTVAALDQLVWEVNPGNDTVRHLLSYVCGYASETLRRFGIVCRVERPDSLPSLPASAGFRRGVLLLVKEAITNVVSHAEADEVEFRVAIDDDVLRLSIIDNGVGLDPTRPVGGDGLRNMRQRAAELGGRAVIEAGPRSGTIVTFELPLAAAERVSP
jgi:signal transduction histidine kinase/ligand-binding sensor domain-containing protein